MVQNISTYQELCIFIFFSLQQSVQICCMFLSTLVGHFNVLRLTEVSTVTELPIHAFYDMFMFAKS